MKISIIIPVYNSENFTLKLIDRIEYVFENTYILFTTCSCKVPK